MATACAALLSLMHNLELIMNHPRHSFSFEIKQIVSLLKCALYLIRFMKEYYSCPCFRKEAAEALAKRIARAAHAAEDVIESHLIDQIRGGSTLDGKKTSRFLLDLQKVIEDMEFVCRKASQVVKAQRGFKVELPTYWETATSSTPLTSAKNSMVGFEGVLLQLLDLLTTGVPSSRQIIPIVGMAGIGKTTLATHAFQHSYIVHYFDVCLWTTISQQYNVERILSELVSCLKNSTRKTVDELGEELYKSLYGKRYLIVLDDMWSVQAWDDIKFFFPDIGNGSRIVLTTRHSHVAHHFGTSHFKMCFLDEGNSWDLFCHKAFKEQVCRPELEEIGKKIVAKCKGLPLEIVVVGGHLRKSSKTLEYWEKVANHMNSILNSADNERCLNILSLSYGYLPIYLKPCFLFMGVFPEDGKILVPDILQLWIAEGFIHPQAKCYRLEDIAMRYLLDLIERNLILVDRLRFDGKILACKIHDLVRELCLKIAKEEEFFYVLDIPQAINRARRIVINDHQPKIYDDTRSGALVHSLICEEGQLSLALKMLRVVNQIGGALANEVDLQQLNLQYLNIFLTCKSYRTLYLPSSISQLWNLQTLKITGNYQSIIAPYEIWEMLQLRHIEVEPICLLDPLPMENVDQGNDFVLRKLRTLLKVENLRLSEEICKRIPNIKELRVSYCDLGKDYDEARSYYCPHNLVRFHQLESLACHFHRDSRWRNFALSLIFPSSLHSLCLSGSRLDWEELTMMVGFLPHLQCIVLKSNSVIGSVWNPVEGGFSRLRSLYINGCDDLVYWNTDKSHFPVLELVYLSDLSKLDEFPSGIGEIPTLRRFGLKFCSLYSTISAMRIVVEQEELGNECLHLRVHVRGDEETLESFNEKIQEEGLKTKNIFVRLSKM